MAFSSTVENIVNIAGNRKIGTGTFAQAGTTDTGGDIDISGFYYVDHISVMPDNASTACGCNETFPISESSATIVLGVGTTGGTFMIYGR